MKQIKKIVAGVLCCLLVFLTTEPIVAASSDTITNNGKVTIASNSSKTDHWLKYKASKTGVVTISTSAKKCKVTLCDANKKALTAKTAFGKSVADAKSYAFAVKKGTTYYLKLNVASKSTFTCKFTALSSSGGNDERSAETLSLNQTKKGLSLNSEMCKYYRIDVDVMNNQPITFSVKTPKSETCGFTFDLLNAADIPLMADVHLNGTQSYTFSNTLAPGTYYIVVKSASKKTTGQYTISYGTK